MSSVRTPDGLLAGIRGIQDLPGVRVTDGPYFCKQLGWTLKIQLEIANWVNKAKLGIPRLSEWFVVIEGKYPLGPIKVYPSKQNGILNTFPHQSLNALGPAEQPWRMGKLCLDAPISDWGGEDPIGDSDRRLRWHLSRAVEWLTAAHGGVLLRKGDPFEVPLYPSTSSKANVVHDESPSTLENWDGLTGRWGYIHWTPFRGTEPTLRILAAEFRTTSGVIIRTAGAGGKPYQFENETVSRGIWWLWPFPAVVSVWQSPLTWGELRQAGKQAGVKVDGTLRDIAQHGDDCQILLLGCPIPLKIGETPTEIHWQAVCLPAMRKDPPKRSGFRTGSKSAWLRARNREFSDNATLNYISTENWHPDKMQARGRLSPKLRQCRAALIGCGSLGASIAELLIRAGLMSLQLIDHDTLCPGNLTRHVLTADDVGQNKALALTKHLRSVSPFSSLQPITHELPEVREKLVELLDDCDIIIDATANNEALLTLSQGWWSTSRLFISACVGYRARRTFIFAHRGHQFPAREFFSQIQPFLDQEIQDWDKEGETIESAGCWSPLFPARYDDIMLAAVASVKAIEQFTHRSYVESELVVYRGILEKEDTPAAAKSNPESAGPASK